MSIIIWTNPDSTVSVTSLAPGVDAHTEAKRLAGRDGHPQHYRIAHPNELPQSRRFRCAWRSQGMHVTVDLNESRTIILSEVRRERDRRLTESDAQRMRTEEIGTESERQALAQYRQALRDFPEHVQGDLNNLQSPDALEAYIPTWPCLNE